MIASKHSCEADGFAAVQLQRSAPEISMKRLLLVLIVACLPLPVVAGQWVATFDQVGPLKIGMTLAQVNQALGAHLTAPEVPGADPSGRCVYLDPPQNPAIRLIIMDSRLARIEIVKDSIKTGTGIGVGDTTAGVTAAYGSRITTEPGAHYPQRGGYLTVLSARGEYGMRFVTLDGRVTTYYSGTAQNIQLVEGCA